MDYNNVRLAVFILLKKWAQNIDVGLMEKMALSMQTMSISLGSHNTYLRDCSHLFKPLQRSLNLITHIHIYTHTPPQ